MTEVLISNEGMQTGCEERDGGRRVHARAALLTLLRSQFTLSQPSSAQLHNSAALPSPRRCVREVSGGEEEESRKDKGVTGLDVAQLPIFAPLSHQEQTQKLLQSGDKSEDDQVKMQLTR